MTDCNQFIRCFRRRVHQVRPPVQKSDVGIERPAIELIGVAIALPGAADQGQFIVSIKEATQGLQPLGGGVLGKPGDIDQQGVVGGIAKQQAADREVGHRFGVARSAAHLEMNATLMRPIEFPYQGRGGVSEGSWHQDVDLLSPAVDRPCQGRCGEQRHNQQGQPPPQGACHAGAVSGKPLSCSSAQSLTV